MPVGFVGWAACDDKGAGGVALDIPLDRGAFVGSVKTLEI